MGAGANCSYTLENGTFVQQLCVAGFSYCCSSTLSGRVCSQTACTSSQQADSGVSISSYIFWVILAGAGLFTLFVLFVSYAVCRFRKPGCADASDARDRFLEENILAAQVRSAAGSTGPTSPISITPAANSPDIGRTPTASPDLLVQRPGVRLAGKTERKGPAKKPSPKSVNRAFIMGAEAFARTSIAVPRPKVGVSGRVTVQPGRARAAPAGPGARGNTQTGLAGRVTGIQRSVDSGSSSGVASPRLVHVGGFTPRVPLREKGRTESKQTILSKDSDSLTTVGT